MLREDLAAIVTSAIDRLIESGGLPEAARGPVEIIDTKNPEHGDFACNFALTAAKAAGMNPRELAERLRSALLGEGRPISPSAHQPISPSLLQEVEIAGPGFLNLRLDPAAVAAYVHKILELGSDLPKSKFQSPKSKINVEFVSVNPNGPITVGSARGAAYGDTLCRVLVAAGHLVHREYYVNDGINSEQMRLFAESVRHYYHSAAGLESSFPEKGYRGDYVLDVAVSVRKLHGEGHDRDETLWFQRRSEELMLERQRQDLHAFGVDFDTWFSEQSLHDSGEVARCIDELIAKGAADEEPHRTVLKMARGGVIEEVVREEQPVEEDDGGDGGDGGDSEHLALSTESPNAPDPNTQHPTPNTSAPNAERRTPNADGAQSSILQSSNPGAAATLWLRSTKFGDDMDRVLRRRDGRLTYIASDVAYHKDKLTDASGTRGTGPVDKLITILGPDHHGYIHRLQAVLAALLEDDGSDGSDGGDGGEPRSPETPNSKLQIPNSLDRVESQIFRSPAERDACRAALEEARRRLEVVIFQIVRFVKDGKPAPMRKRDGNIYELRDLINELGKSLSPNAPKEEQQTVGADVARFFYLMRSHDTHMDFDIDLATKHSDDNPVFYVQYAHARICSVLRKAQEPRIGGLEDCRIGEQLSGSILQSFNPLILGHVREQTLIKKILDLPTEVARRAEDYGVHRLTSYAVELARTYHHFYDACRVIQPGQPELTQARLALCEASRIALKATLDLLGVSAPERMESRSED